MKQRPKWQFVLVAVLAAFCLAGCATGYPQFPWMTWGEVSKTTAGEDNPGWRGDGYIEQGVDWTKLGNKKWSPVLNTFAGFRFNVSNRPNYWWDNKLGPWFGIKLKWDVEPYPGAWGQVALGVRGEYYTYLGTIRDRPFDSDLRCVVFLQWSFGGKWPIGNAKQ